MQEVVDFFKSKESSPVEGELFFHHYQSKGWMVGRNKMKNWQSAASGWITRGKTQPQIFGSNNGQPQDGSGDPRRDPSTKRIQIFS